MIVYCDVTSAPNDAHRFVSRHVRRLQLHPDDVTRAMTYFEPLRLPFVSAQMEGEKNGRARRELSGSGSRNGLTKCGEGVARGSG